MKIERDMTNIHLVLNCQKRNFDSNFYCLKTGPEAIVYKIESLFIQHFV